ncbi:hypothetical protein QO002_005803 [Pararhizobium capsulatum DSM 1112]|uniref:Uncharacterized protein n=1 Tax=Pararhizobium capsulatum DSM 1112 TaxID=1121113 RepID=A0ABU0C072_9HYPH|nr:hypothetical protein [Pararhizobium capsulatum DSM 1112]
MIHAENEPFYAPPLRGVACALTVISHHFRFDDTKQAQVFRSPHRYIWPAELDLMGQLAGFELECRHADWRGTPFTSESRSHVSVFRLADY